jgi:hypothetical protein
MTLLMEATMSKWGHADIHLVGEFEHQSFLHGGQPEISPQRSLNWTTR